MWTHFWDMHSGGRTKEEPYNHIYIEAPEEEAIVIFYNRFGHNPNRVTCTCCGEDYSISSNESLEQLTGFHRGCHYDDNIRKYREEKSRHKYDKNKKYYSLLNYIEKEDVLLIRDKDILDSQREGSVPQQGYIYV